MKKNFYCERVTICKLSTNINENGEWVRCIEKYKETWAYIQQTFIKGHMPYFRVLLSRHETLPESFCIRIHNIFHIKTAPPILSPDKEFFILTCVPSERLKEGESYGKL